MSRLVTVFGATGNQAGSVIAHILSSPTLSSKYSLRAVTRDPTSPAATGLAAKGVDVVKADLKDAGSVKKAIMGSYAVFGATNYWEIHCKDGEIEQGKNIADASKAAGVTHLIWSSLPHTTKLTGGTLTKLSHFDSKAEVEEYIEKIKGDLIATYYRPAGFMTNFKQSINPGPDGAPTYFAPLDTTKTHFPVIDVKSDTGKYVAGILEAGASANGAHVNGVGEWLTPTQIVETLSKIIGSSVVFKQVPPEIFKSFLPPAIAEELTENLLLIKDFSYYGLGSELQQTESDRFLLPGTKLTTWEQFVKENGPWKW
ncbi:hypothetical protein IFR05_014951 [Cadophora sp. M221]|nr:hypothetical protein IFR05_014951 [Cadophora sp. M221]